MNEIIEEIKKSEYDTLKEQVELWKHKYKSQCSKMGAYKAEVAKEIREREQNIKWKEWRIEDKERFLKENNFESLKKQKEVIEELSKKIEQKDFNNRKQLYEDFEIMKKNILDELSQELIRWTEENDVDNQRSQGYIIGINKAKKIICERMICVLKEKTFYEEKKDILEKIKNET